LEHIGSFGVSGYCLRDTHLFRDADETQLAAVLANCAVCRFAKGKPLADSLRERLYIVLAERGADGAVSQIFSGESVGERSVLDEATNLADIGATDDTELLLIEAELVFWYGS